MITVHEINFFHVLILNYIEFEKAIKIFKIITCILRLVAQTISWMI